MGLPGEAASLEGNIIEDQSHSTCSGPNAAEVRGSRHQRGGPVVFWWIMVTVSGATSLLATRTANPLAVDDVLTAALLFFVVPAVVVLILGAFQRLLGVALAALFPFGWLLIASDSADGALLWLVPIIGAALVVAAAAQLYRPARGHGVDPGAARRAEGRVFIEEGDVIHAEVAELTAEAAFHHFMTWYEGEFVTAQCTEFPDRTIHDSAMSLLMEGARLADEAGH